MKKILVLFAIALSAGLIFFVMNSQKEIDKKNSEFSSMITSTADLLSGKLSVLAENVGKDQMDDFISFAKEKSIEGELDSKEGIKKALDEAEEKFNASIDDNAKEEIAKSVMQLESMGFSSEVLVKKAESIYEKYGEEFSGHLEEIFVETAQETAKKAAEGLWDNITQNAEEGIKSLFETK